MEILKKELEILRLKTKTDLNEDNFQISEKLVQRKFQSEDAKNILKNLLFSLSFEKKSIMSLDSIEEIDEYKGKELGTLLTFSELFLSLNEKNIKEV